ncbi:MAG: histidine kinase [Pseudomonadota bacterium]|nr:histidine kinase [Pseudomonadota bacterium]
MIARPETFAVAALRGVSPHATSSAHWYAGLRWRGFAIVAIVALIDAVRQSIKFIVTEPFQQWVISLLVSYAYAAFIGCTILLAVVRVLHRVPRRGLRQYAALFVAVAVATAVAVTAIMVWEDWDFHAGVPQWSVGEFVLGLGLDWPRYALLGSLVTAVWLYERADAEQTAALEYVALESARMDQQTAEARLQMLEAQIEPHFLFNTLANVKRLYDTDRHQGARMLRNLKQYLAVALPQMRETESTLGREIDHITAYLNIQQIRMGRRLAFMIDVPAGLRNARMPALMLLTLAENAIKHGLGPSTEGGRIDLRASTESGRLRIQISDTGQGFAKSGGGGTGLANIRARLAALFGNAASLSLGLNSPHGVVATIELPYQEAASARRSA